MKGIILAGGSGSRLYPLTKVTNKHLLPIYDKPMIYYPLMKIIECGINEVMIVSGKGHAGHFLELLGSGNEFGISITYEVQERSGGIAEALSLCEKWTNDSDVLVILGDNIIEDNLSYDVEHFISGAHLFLKGVVDAHRFGVANLDDKGNIINIIEKPTNPTSNLAVIGAYIYDSRVFNIIKELTYSDRNELEITDVNNRYMMMGAISHSILNGYWSDAGTFDSLMKASNIIYQNSQK